MSKRSPINYIRIQSTESSFIASSGRRIRYPVTRVEFSRAMGEYSFYTSDEHHRSIHRLFKLLNDNPASFRVRIELADGGTPDIFYYLQ